MSRRLFKFSSRLLAADKRYRLSSTANLITTLTVLNGGLGCSEGGVPIRRERRRGLAPSVRTCEGSFRPELAREPVSSRSPPINPATYDSAVHWASPLITVPVTVGTEKDGSGGVVSPPRFSNSPFLVNTSFGSSFTGSPDNLLLPSLATGRMLDQYCPGSTG